MVLVDTSVWIRFLANRAPYATELDHLLQHSDVAGHDLIYGELLIGDSGGRSELLNSYKLMHRLPSAAHFEVVLLVRAQKLYRQGIGWIDAHLLASALIAKASFWTADERLARLAGTLGIGYTAGL